jgi:hypothetical protein
VNGVQENTIPSLNSSATLNGAITDSDTTITVNSTTGYPPKGTLTIETEYLTYTGTTATTFTGVTRGTNSSISQAHANNTKVNVVTFSVLSSGGKGITVTSDGSLNVTAISIPNFTSAGSFALGYGNTASGYFSTALGQQNNVTGGLSFAVGQLNLATAFNSATIGGYLNANAMNDVVIGQYNNLISGSSNTWVATDPLFEIGNGTSYGARSNALTVLKNGTVGIGTVSPGFTLDVNGSIAAVGALQAHSDKRLKKNIVNVDHSLDKLITLNGVLFDWRKDEFPGIHFEDRRQMGVIAQDVEKVFPEAVSKNREGLRSVAYTMLIAPIIEAFKELNNKILRIVSELNSHSLAISSIDQKVLKLQNENSDLLNRLSKMDKENAAIRALLCKSPEAKLSNLCK